jgi:carbon-monoxide dehydrogenase medium subunit
MIPSKFDYHAPKTLKKALSLIGEHGDNAKVLAGGHSLIPLMKLRFAAPDVVIDLGQVGGLSGIRVSRDGIIHIGAMSTHYAVESARSLKSKCPLLPETASVIGDAQVRNRGTIGGSLVHADPAADWPATILALDAQLEISSANGSRKVAAGDFFVDLLTTDIQPGELLTEITMPVPAGNSGGAYEKMHQSASGFAIAGVAAQISLDSNGNCASAGIGITGVASVPYRASAVESAIEGGPLTEDAIAAAADKAVEGVDQDDLQGDLHASGEYRAHLAKLFTARAITKAAERAG